VRGSCLWNPLSYRSVAGGWISLCEHRVRMFVAYFESGGFDLFYVEVNDML
jgi:hypothetical protein